MVTLNLLSRIMPRRILYLIAALAPNVRALRRISWEVEDPKVTRDCGDNILAGQYRGSSNLFVIPLSGPHQNIVIEVKPNEEVAASAMCQMRSMASQTNWCLNSSRTIHKAGSHVCIFQQHSNRSILMGTEKLLSPQCWQSIARHHLKFRHSGHFQDAATQSHEIQEFRWAANSCHVLSFEQYAICSSIDYRYSRLSRGVPVSCSSFLTDRSIVSDDLTQSQTTARTRKFVSLINRLSTP